MMRRMMIVSITLVVAAAANACADEATVKRELTQLSQVTGDEPRSGALQSLLDEKEKTRELIKSALPLAAKEDPSALSYNAAFILGLAAAELKDMKSAEALLRSCMKQAIKLQSVLKLYESYVGLVELFMAEKDYDGAERICRDLLALKTDEGPARIVYRASTNQAGEYDFEEDDTFDSARRLKPTVQETLVKTLAKQGKFEQALKLVDGLIKQADDWRDRHLKGWVLRESGQLDKAADIYEDVLKRVGKDTRLDAKQRDRFTSGYHYELSNLYVDLNNVDKASEHLQVLIKREPEQPGYYNDLGYIWADHDIKLDEAEQLIRKALELDRARRKKRKDFDPKTDHDNGAYLDSLGWVYYKQKKLKDAKETLQKAVEDTAAQHIEIYDHLGDVLLALGERAGAMAAWRKGLEHVGDSRREQERRSAVERKLDKNR